jgi:3-oxoacyl-[acyl-carrier protein] reductase
MRTAVVTGASGDLGRVVVQRLLADGVCVLAQVHSGPLAPAERLLTVRADLLSPTGVRDLVAAVPPEWKGLDLLVNCVGGARPTPFADLPAEEWSHCLALNVTAPFLVMRGLLDLLREASGCVVNLASVAAMTGGAFGPHYAAAKAAVIGLSRSAARDPGPVGVRVNVVAPGPVASRMTDSLPPEQLDALLAGTALRRLVQPDEVAETVVWLGSVTAVTGQTVIVDGGRVFA